MAKKKSFQIGNALTEGLQETVTAAENYSGDLRVEVIPLKKLELDPQNPRDLLLTFEDLYEGIDKADANFLRKVAEKESLQSIANSIKEQGIINPVVVYKHGEKYRLVAGERRTLGSIIAGRSHIQAKILDDKPTDLNISLLQWMENIERSDLSLGERLKNLEQVLAAFSMERGLNTNDINAANLSRLIGCSIPHAMNYKAVLCADDYIKCLIQENKIKNLEKAAVLASIKSTDIKAIAIDACLTGATLKKLKGIASQDNLGKRERIQTKLRTGNRGRNTTVVNFGKTTQVNVAKIILNTILQNEKYSHLNVRFGNIDWTDFKSINNGFKQLLKVLEKVES